LVETAQRYRRSVLGPMWVSLSLAVWVGGIGVVFSFLFKVPIEEYLPYVCSGVVLWRMLFLMVSDGCNAFTVNQRYILQIEVPLFTYILRTCSISFIILLHHLLVYVVVAIIFNINVSWNMLYFIPGIILLMLNGVWVVTLLAFVSSRFRDVPHIVDSLMQLLFFVTPIFWRPEQIGRGGNIVLINPIYHLIEIVRAPLLGNAPPSYSWGVAILILLVGGGVAIWTMNKLGHRIPYWL